MTKNYNNIYTVCYDTLDVFKSKEDAKNFYSDCYHMSEGAEHERYASILVDLNFSNIGKDNVSIDCNEINIQTNEKEKFLKIELDDHLSIDDIIKYYEEKIQPILEVSDDYDVNFNSSDPFIYFGSDAESYTNSSFSNYYKEILEKLGVTVDNIYTDDWSDGKYKLVVNNAEFKLTAWDNLKSVIDNVNSMIELFRKKHINMEI